MVASLAPSSWRMLWPTRAWRHPMHLQPIGRLEAYSNPALYSLLSEYTTMAQVVHGPDYDPRTEENDGEVLMRVGGGNMHGQY
jgi:hypothetical protein